MIFLLAVPVLLVSLVFLANRYSGPAKSVIIPVQTFQVPPMATEKPIKIMTWNLGYAALSHKADFKLDGGTSWRHSSKDTIVKNSIAIGQVLTRYNSDILLFQEIARPGWNTRGVDLESQVSKSLPNHAPIYLPDTQTRLLPPPISINTGSSIYTQHPYTEARSSRLPQEPYRFGCFRKWYRTIEISIPTESRSVTWTILNIHLAAFDDGRTRAAQLAAIKRIMLSHYKQGRHVVVGGDWNMRLTDTNFPHSTDQDHLFWLKDLPDSFIPSGWKLTIDKTTPTVRTLESGYTQHKNYTTIVDGFLVSPNVKILEIKTIDLQFSNSDHNPVQATLVAK